jgi:NDP-sugar pyrophosphorylase family protein
MNHPSLVILAAGMGSRYGGLKQIDTVGNNGESIIDFSIYDAIRAGFKKVYLIIRKEHEAAFNEALVNDVRKFVEVEYIFQDKNDLPEGFSCPEGREKPWGTTHALWACRKQVNEPFMICNADDYYGKDAFKSMFDFLSTKVSDSKYAMVGYRLNNTLSDSGSVSRGVCDVENGYLKGVVERKEIKRLNGEVIVSDDGSNWSKIDEKRLVSMNFWGFTPKVFELAERQFIAFLKRELDKNPLKCEHVIPTMVGETLNEGLYSIEALPSENTWFGVTYQEDKPYVVKQFVDFKEKGEYPFDLWK